MVRAARRKLARKRWSNSEDRYTMTSDVRLFGLRLVVDCGQARISNSRLPLGVITVASSPTFLFNNARPMGDVVEIFPAPTSDSSLVTSLY